LPLAIFSALESPGGDAEAARLSLFSIALALAGLLVSERLAARLRT
jgi:molybdate transport system permease protein